MTAFASLGGMVIATGGRPGPTGEVLAARQAGPAAASPAQTTAGGHAAATPTATVAVTPAARSAPAPSPTTSASPAAVASRPPSRSTGVDLVVQQTSQRTWRGAQGELRLQVIAKVRNTGTTWLRLARSASTYNVYDRSHRTVAGGVFTAVIPELIEPGATGYLVDTLSVAFGSPSDFATSRVHVKAAPVAAPQAHLSVPSVSISIATGGLRAVGEARNDGDVTASSVAIGVVVLDRAGRPLAALYDLSDAPQLEPGATDPFSTEYPGAPPVSPENAAQVVGYAFITGD